MQKRLSCFLIATTLTASGCVDGPFYAMKRANPFFRAQWEKDRQIGPTFEDRLSELDLLKTQMASLDSEKQNEWSVRLEQLIQSDPSPEMRARAVLVIAQIPTESAVRALNTASADESEKVRVMACKAWKVRKDPAARDMLMSLATKKSETTSVRQAAIESLAVFPEDEVKSTLAALLDERSPAIQFQVAQSLKTITGKDYGGDFDSWRKFMQGQEVPEPESKTMMATISEALPQFK